MQSIALKSLRHKIPHSLDALPSAIRVAATSRVLNHSDRCSHNNRLQQTNGAPNGKIVAIGASTGGVEALMHIFRTYPRNCPPTIVTQHMPAVFSRSFAARLNKLCLAEVTEAVNGDVIEAGRVYIAPGTSTHLELTRSDKLRCRLRASDPISGHRPSVDALFNSVASTVGGESVGVILTGMGSDGAAGLARMHSLGAPTLGQSEPTCVVFGMPKSAWKAGAIDKFVPLPRMCEAILSEAMVG